MTEIKTRTAEVTEAQSLVAAKDKEIVILHSTMTDTNESVASLKEEIASMVEKVATQQKAVEDANDKVRVARTEVSSDLQEKLDM